MTLTRKEHARRSFLIHELARLSRNGWRDARPVDYQPLEAELEQLTGKARDGVRDAMRGAGYPVRRKEPTP